MPGVPAGGGRGVPGRGPDGPEARSGVAGEGDPSVPGGGAYAVAINARKLGRGVADGERQKLGGEVVFTCVLRGEG